MRLRDAVLKRSQGSLWLHHLRSTWVAELNDAALLALMDSLSLQGGPGDALVGTLRQRAMVEDAPYEPVPERSSSELVTIELESIARCNLACQGCHAERSSAVMTDVTFRAVLEGAVLLGAVELVFRGGEPLLNRRAADWLELATARGLRTRLWTNATLASGRTARRLANAGVAQVLVTLRGFEQEHDARFGAGAHRRAEQGIRQLVEQGLSVQVVSPCLDERFRRHCREVLGVAGVRTSLNSLPHPGKERLRVTARGEVHCGGLLGSLTHESLAFIYATLDRRREARRRPGACFSA